MASTLTFDVLFPMMTCPVCGREFLKRKDWGCVVTVRGNSVSPNSSFVRLCSIPCMRAYEEELLAGEAKKAAKLRCCKTYKMRMIDGLSVEETRKRLGHRYACDVTRDVSKADTVYYREIDWLNRHGWEVTA